MSQGSTPKPRTDFPLLKLFSDDPEEPDDGRPLSFDGQISASMTLLEFFEHWYLPIVLLAEGADEATIVSYRESLAYWARITGNPPLVQIDEFTIAKFCAGIKTATYRRSPRAGAREYPLAAHTITKHMRQVRTVLKRTGPTVNPDRPGKALLASAPHLKVTRAKSSKPKPPFPMDVGRRIYAAIDHMPATDKMTRQQVRLFWRALLLVLYYTGLRIGTVLKLELSMIEHRTEGPLLNIPGWIVDKTQKPLEKYLHPEALAAIEALRPTGLLLPWPHGIRHIGDRHYFLQSLAGIPEAQQLSPHAWRRTHGTEMARLGARYGIKIAQRTLDHADDRTTSMFYVDIEAELIRKLPSPIPPPDEDTQQLRLF